MAVFTSTYLDPLSTSEQLSAHYEEERADNQDTGAFVGGIESGMYGLRSSLNEALAAGGRILGADNYAAQREQAADVLASRAAGAGHMIPRLSEIEGIGDTGSWALGALGQNLPLLGAMTGTGLAGRALGGVLGRTKRQSLTDAVQ
jgi:hypothetical protein